MKFGMFNHKACFNCIRKGAYICMVGWTNFGVTQSNFLLTWCDSYVHTILYILELFNGTHFEIMNLNRYIMKLIEWKVHKIVGAMNFWIWKSRYVTLSIMKWMHFGLVLWWTLKYFRDLVFVFKCNNEIRLEGFYSYLMKFMSYELLFGEKQTHVFSKAHYILKKTK